MTLRKMPLLDAASLQLEGKNMPMHIAALMTFSYPTSLTDHERKTFVSSLIARWREETRVVYPWNQVLTRPTRWQLRPATREVYDLDLEYHLRQWSLPAPGGEKELGHMIAWIHELPMDLEKPLWECHFIEGLSDNRFALYVKIHHALVDGISGTRLVVGSLSTDADSLSTPMWAKVQAEIDTGGAKASDRGALPSLSDLKAGVAASLKLRTKNETLTTFRSTPETILNGPIGAHRRVATQHFELARLKTLAKTTGATVNDVVLAIVGGALREYLLEANALPEDSLTAALPVSTRKPGDVSIGNQVSLLFGSLGTNIADPALRLEYVKRSTQAGKAMLNELPAHAVNVYSLLSTGPFLSSVVLGIGRAGRQLFNTTVSNVPGQREARYLDGAELLHVYPVSLIMPGIPLNFTCVSHGDFLNFGMVACRDRVPHVQRLAVGMVDALEELENNLLKRGENHSA
ncbi:wax ester/triacylglycerol synthase family O-acyltransferase [Marinobacter sp. M216]|uniref:diacylglycerol O-acyltransferase n=1 Tax=Marinobacter albus TaxID=3030833 RepID=A0ABT7HEF5_9GAMM|nr:MULTISPECIES: wax ester/triacylglycerol synthase family O-acyltransferase [unclassified Marinobacter]MBW7472173.1 wax ester/triacylglycerol synthase family O-acyltransferase [Marinobacter sp. F4218]MDK9558743.1 wax ester/triacylglycerol synthase family O-acyltransferase [Marinobacter sp. M216]